MVGELWCGGACVSLRCGGLRWCEEFSACVGCGEVCCQTPGHSRYETGGVRELIRITLLIFFRSVE